MSDKVVPMFAEGLRTANDEPHLSGKAVCLACRHEWVSVAPVGTTTLTCPACQLDRGEFTGNIMLDGDHYECPCGGSLFRITPQAVYCPRCGRTHRPFDDEGRRA